MANLGEHLHTILKDFLEPQEIDSILLKNIELLSTNVELGLNGLLMNLILKEIARGILDHLAKTRSIAEEMLIYELVTSKTMLRLIRDLKDELDGERLKGLLTRVLLGTKAAQKNYISMIIYREVYNYIGVFLEPKRTNTSIVFESSKNSERSEFIEDLRLTSYRQIIDNFTDLTIYNKVSASPTIVFSGILKKTSAQRVNAVREMTILNKPRLFFKVERADAPTGYEIFEQMIYRELFKLVKSNMTPHILCRVATNTVLPEFYDNCKTISDEFRLKLEKEMTKTNLFLIENGIVERDVPWNITRLLVTQQGDVELYKILDTEVNLDRLKRILFQLFYTLYVFEHIECNHGDLHFANVFVNKLSGITDYYYKVNGILYKINTDETVKIFDFDCSKIFKNTDVTVNTKKGMIIEEVDNIRGQLGITNVYNKNIDKVKVLLNLLHNDTLAPLIKQMLPGLNKEDETIRETYIRLLFSDANQEQNRIEASRIFGVEIKEESDIDRCGISKFMLDKSWKKYFGLISLAHAQNWIIKSGLLPDSRKDHLWIPDEIVLPNQQILALLANPVEENINVRNGPVYTIDGRL